MFATGFLVLAACLFAQVIVGDDVWNRSAWRRYFFPGFGFVMGLAMWPVAVLAGGSTIHLLAHCTWAQVMMLAGGAHLGLARGKLQHRFWRLTMPLALGVSGIAFLGHEEHGWLYSRSALVHHICGWTLVVGALFPLGAAFRLELLPPRIRGDVRCVGNCALRPARQRPRARKRSVDRARRRRPLRWAAESAFPQLPFATCVRGRNTSSADHWAERIRTAVRGKPNGVDGRRPGAD
jgi:hypothetical protein